MKPIIRIISTMALFCICLPHFSFSQTGSISVLSPVCNHNGILVATITGGTPGNFYSYSWFTNSGSVMHFSNDFSDTLYNFSGGPVMVYIEENSAPFDLVIDTISYAFDLQFTVVPDSCPLQTGAITTTINGAFPPVTYNWTYGGIPYGGNTPSITNLTGGIYDCVITDGAGCQMNLTDMLTDSALSNYPGVVVPSVTNLSLSVSTTPSNCNNGTATVVATGGAQPYNYLWSNGQTTATATGVFAPSFINVTVTDNNGCVEYSGAYFTSTVFISPNFSTTPSNCAFNNGAISVNPTGGTAPYTFLWNTMAVSQNISNLPVGVYSVIITDAAGCVNTSYANVFAISPVNVTQSFTPSICTGATGTATLNATGGTAPYSYLWYTTPVQVTQTATGLAPGIYNFSVTDSQGCIKTGSVNVPQNTNLIMFANSAPSVCALNNGSASMNVMGGTIPYSYLWSNGQTTDSISGLTPGNYFCTVTDASGCSVSDCINVNSTSQLYCILNPQPATCLYTADGAISINIITGTAPYTYQWSNGMTSSSISGLLPGNYHVTVTDANGCTFSQSVNVSFTSVNPCTSIIQGKVYIDLNNNCIMDPGEPTMENIPVRCNTTNEIVFTDVNGNYQFYHPSGTAEIEQLPMPYRYQSCPAANPFTVVVPATGLTITQNIGDTVDWVTDLTVGIWNWSSPPVVGNNYVKKVVEFNRGTIAVSSNNQYDYDAQAPFVSSTTAPTSFVPIINRAGWFNALSLPLRKREYNVTHYIPPTTPINTALLYTDTIFPVTGDTTWWDNSLMRIDYTVGPYDPNYKEVTPRGIGAEGFISPTDSILEYVIHFQNLGNYYAQNVLITDQLSNYLEPSTLRVRYATDPVNTRISASGVIEFIFNNIYLPPLQYDSLNSNGFVVYTVHLKPNLPDGTEITNSANIYFDYNPPIETNTTINTISITGINNIISENNIIVYPNPNSGNFLVYLKDSFTGKIKFTLYNISGQQIFDRIEEVVGKREFAFDQDEISPGVYILNIQTSERVIRKKVVINR